MDCIKEALPLLKDTIVPFSCLILPGATGRTRAVLARLMVCALFEMLGEETTGFLKMKAGFGRIRRHVVLRVRQTLENDEIGGDARFP